MDADDTQHPTPHTLAADDLEYHRELVAAVLHARQQLAEAQAAFRFWAGHLAHKYALTGDDRITPDGKIERF